MIKNQLPETYRHPLPNGLHFDMVLVRAGTFVMGSGGEEAHDWEKPEHLVRLTQDYYIGIFPVTQAIWKSVMHGHNPSRFVGDQRPVEQVSWQDIVEGGQDENVPESFMGRINELFPVKEPALAGFHFRLPTEAEWEYAACGSKQILMDAAHRNEKIQRNSSNYEYAGSDQLKEVGWYKLNSHSETKEVGLKKPNLFGLYDMSGNVWEWCLDALSKTFYQECLERGVIENPLCQQGHYRVIRGGSWSDSSRFCRVSCRSVDRPSDRYDGFGFRLVLSPQFSGNAKDSYGTE